jgi:molybdopterin converting factor small subunit
MTLGHHPSTDGHMKNHITLKLFATFAKHAPGGTSQYAVEPETTVETLLEELRIPVNQVKLIFINGRNSTLDTILKDGDRVGIFPPVGGG